MKKCLIIDDASVIRKVAQAILVEMNFEVLEAEDTETALKLCQTENPDVVILDWHIPNSDPIEFLHELRSTAKAHEPKVIYCTTEKSSDVIGPALDAGVDDILIKPFDRSTFINKIADLKLAA